MTFPSTESRTEAQPSDIVNGDCFSEDGTSNRGNHQKQFRVEFLVTIEGVQSVIGRPHHAGGNSPQIIPKYFMRHDV
jgi:hypothetical protein